MLPSDVRAYLDRDWEALARLKDEFWIAEKERLGVDWAFQVADELYHEARARNPGWPTEEERDEDLATHERVSEALKRVRVSPR